MKRCATCGTRLGWQISKYFPHTCPSPRRGWYWCNTCRAWRYANPSALATCTPRCWRCSGPMPMAFDT